MNNILNIYCRSCNLLKTNEDFYNGELKCKKCKYLSQKEKIESTKQLIKTLYDKIEKVQNINNMLIENNINKDTEIKILRDENEKLKIFKKRNGAIFNN